MTYHPRWSDDPYYYPEPEFYCEACRDVGWLECCDSGHSMIIACTECSSELDEFDLDDSDV